MIVARLIAFSLEQKARRRVLQKLSTPSGAVDLNHCHCNGSAVGCSAWLGGSSSGFELH
jgi:hypothetical protein